MKESKTDGERFGEVGEYRPQASNQVLTCIEIDL